MRKFRRPVLVTLLVLAVSFVVLEIGARLLIRSTVDGQQTFMRAKLRPYVLPVRHTQQLLDSYFDNDTVSLRFNDLLGWDLWPERGQITEQGLRSDTLYAPVPTDEAVLRIATFGDSFTYGAEVELEESWPYQLQSILNERGIRAEVLNFGVPAYGIDQAFLRYTHFGADWRPDAVIHGFVYEDMYRNLNVFTPLYVADGGLPFSKPRFIDTDQGLALVNSPVIALNDVPAALASLGDSPLAAAEYYYQPGDFAPRWWQHSRFLALLEEVLNRIEIRISEFGFRIDLNDSANVVPLGFYAPDSEASRVTLGIWRQWVEAVQANCGQFMIVHLPRWGDLDDYRANLPIVYADFLSQMQAEFHIVETLGQFSDDVASNFAENEHYSPAGNQVIAQAVAADIETQLTLPPAAIVDDCLGGVD
jgi:lysophospholipase L1-like esterase